MAKTSTSFKKGQSGNINGRPPKGYSIVDVMKEMLGEKPDIKKALVTKLFKLALEKDDMTAIKEIINRTDGMPKQDIDVKSDGEKIEMPIVYIPEEK